ncbi:MAG: hypothetical protein JOS17DRAFT_272996 [Linnemannia elongata]|nr:MAG: hypothetical protein JOS17DRAFT_272996 [Linnemannia elongata]
MSSCLLLLLIFHTFQLLSLIDNLPLHMVGCSTHEKTPFIRSGWKRTDVQLVRDLCGLGLTFTGEQLKKKKKKAQRSSHSRVHRSNKIFSMRTVLTIQALPLVNLLVFSSPPCCLSFILEEGVRARLLELWNGQKALFAFALVRKRLCPFLPSSYVSGSSIFFTACSCDTFVGVTYKTGCK